MLLNIQPHLLLKIMQEKLNLVKYLHLIRRQLVFIFTCSFCIHLWHAGRALFKDIWSGLCVTIESLYHVEYGRNEKLGDNTTKTSTYL